MKHNPNLKSSKKGKNQSLKDQQLDIVQQQKLKGGNNPWANYEPIWP